VFFRSSSLSVSAAEDEAIVRNLKSADIYLIVSIIDQPTAQSTNHRSIKDIIDQPSID
jgi:hypothetical protein